MRSLTSVTAVFRPTVCRSFFLRAGPSVCRLSFIGDYNYIYVTSTFPSKVFCQGKTGTQERENGCLAVMKLRLLPPAGVLHPQHFYQPLFIIFLNPTKFRVVVRTLVLGRGSIKPTQTQTSSC